MENSKKAKHNMYQNHTSLKTQQRKGDFKIRLNHPNNILEKIEF